MAFPHDGFPYMEHPPSRAMFLQHHVQFPGYMPQSTPTMVYPQYPFADYADFMHPGMLLEEYDDSAEIATRPRLTKEQVEILEGQFQAHPKPNSMVKKQLAIQTKLTLPRVANWFQNRRAKAKQQKKQEEYEISQQTGGPKTENSSKESVVDDSTRSASPQNSASATINESITDVSEPHSPIKSSDAAKEASWLSLQRALGAAEAARQQRAQEQQVQAQMSMLPPDVARPIAISHAANPSQTSHSALAMPSAEWPNRAEMLAWASSPPAVDYGFDFGFDSDALSQGRETSNEPGSMIDQYVSPSEWSASYMGNTSSAHASDYCGVVSPPLPLPAYPTSRRGSGAEELTQNFGTFALAGTPPVPLTPLSHVESLRSTEGEIDIASRRKRPRPAALTSASLRSRSYGALSSTSPAFRPGPPSGGQLRHVKSTGHALNTHYAGVRKASIPQKSPLNFASFAEAEAFRELMAHQAAAKTPQPPTCDLGTAKTIKDVNEQMSFPTMATTQQSSSEMMSPYTQLQSPPETPYQQEFMLQAGMGMQTAQYANFADYTPPYSAGPLTNSTCSWSDAGIQSPDLPNFPTGTYMSSLGFNHHDAGFQQFVLPSDHIADTPLHPMSEDRKTEFFITEFPGQKEEHANVAQHLTPQKPKNYVFANTAPCDYDS